MPDSALRYVSDEVAGWRRVRHGRGFAYLDARGRAIRNSRELGRIRRLAIPPASRNVWICPDPEGYLQATGRDARGRKQYRYHSEWRALREETKFDRLAAFGRALPRIRRRVAADLRRPGLPREKVVATAVCRKSYVHPLIIEAYSSGQLARLNGRTMEQRLQALLRCRRTNGRGNPLQQRKV